MKQLLLFLFVFGIIGSTYASGDKRLEFSVKETSKGKTNPGWTEARVELELKNLTDDTLTFLTLTHHEDLFSIEGDSVFHNAMKWFITGPAFLTLAPHSSYKENISVVSWRSDANFSAFKVKITLVESQEKYDPFIAAQETDKKQFSIMTDYIQIK